MATTTEFDDNDKFLLIDCVKAQPAIWDITLKDYKKKDKSAEWKNVVQDMEDATGREFKGLNTNKFYLNQTIDAIVDDAKARWEALRRQFSNTKKRKRTGDGAEAGNPPVWRFWMPMLFIECADVSVERFLIYKINLKCTKIKFVQNFISRSGRSQAGSGPEC